LLNFPIEFDQINSLALRPFENVHQLIKVLESMSKNFNISRDKIHQNYIDEAKISAYLCYFFSTNILKISACLDRLSPDLVSEIQHSNIIDFGTGPGTTLIGLIHHYGEMSGDLIGIDTSELMLKQARVLKDKYYANFKIKYQTDLDLLPSKNVTLIFSNSLNEVGSTYANNLIKKIKPERILLLEPGTKESFSEVKKIQAILYEQEYRVNYPCSKSLSCPLDDQNWCHQYINLRFSQSIESLTQRMKKDRRNSPVIFHMYSKKEMTQNSNIVFRYLGENKYSFEFEVCNHENIIEKHRVLKSSLKKLGVKKSKMKLFFLAGLEINLKIDKEITSNFFQSKLIITQ